MWTLNEFSFCVPVGSLIIGSWWRPCWRWRPVTGKLHGAAFPRDTGLRTCEFNSSTEYFLKNIYPVKEKLLLLKNNHNIGIISCRMHREHASLGSKAANQTHGQQAVAVPLKQGHARIREVWWFHVFYSNSYDLIKIVDCAILHFWFLFYLWMQLANWNESAVEL